MTPQEFCAKWAPGAPAQQLNERAGAQDHFIDLCRVLGVPEPGDPEQYCFERGVTKTGSALGRTDGFADVWKRGCFGWEYKSPGADLKAALRQLMMDALPLEIPPLLVVCERLRSLWLTPEAWRPKRSNREITEQAARTFAGSAERPPA